MLTRSRSVLLHESQKSPPCITVGLRPQLEVFESSNPLEFKVIFLGEPLPLITWKKDDIAIDSINIKSKTNCSILFLDRVSAEDAGLYSCTVENSEGKVETRCQLTVMAKMSNIKTHQNASDPHGVPSYPIKACPPKIIDHLRTLEAEDGSEIELCCKIWGNSSFDVVWIHNGKEIKPSKDFQYHHNDSLYMLKIPELFPEDSGIYTCEAFNDYGETFTTCSLYVTCPGKKPPTGHVIKTFPKSISVSRGAPVVVSADLDPGCDRQVTWLKDGVVIDRTDVNPGQNKVQFSIVESGLRDNGFYEMHVNFQGEEHAAAFAINVL